MRMIRNMLTVFQGGKKPVESLTIRQRLFFENGPDTVYAIGDVHGCYDLLLALEEKILLDAGDLPGEKWLIMLGDYVDRGPKSAAVLDRLMGKPSDGIERFCLAGNHEDVMLDFLRNPSADHRWLEFGGLETLHSYGIQKIPSSRRELQDLIHGHIPQEHLAFLEKLPSLVSLPDFCFVHAGIENGVALADQDDMTLLWKRPESTGSQGPQNSFTVVHGHTPVRDVEQGAGRINVDTGAYMSGVLSAVRIDRNRGISVIQSGHHKKRL